MSLADPLSLARLTCANAVAALVASGVRDRAGASGRLGWWSTVIGATVFDWLDGPLARRSGATRHGATLDIESDSWLTLWSAIAATAWGELPPWIVLPPVLRYLHPLLDLRAGNLPRGGRPGISRATGFAQMILILLALAPANRRPSPRVTAAVALAVSGSQLTTLLASLVQRRRCRCPK